MDSEAAQAEGLLLMATLSLIIRIIRITVFTIRRAGRLAAMVPMHRVRMAVAFSLNSTWRDTIEAFLAAELHRQKIQKSERQIQKLASQMLIAKRVMTPIQLPEVLMLREIAHQNAVLLLWKIKTDQSCS